MELLRPGIDAGPAVLCHVDGSQSKRIRNPKGCEQGDEAFATVATFLNQAGAA
jgi:hypothetical protein